MPLLENKQDFCPCQLSIDFRETSCFTMWNSMKAGSSETGGGVLVLHKTLDILENILGYDGKSKQAGVKLSDLARAVNMPKATVYRILSTLESRGFLDRGSD